MSIATSSPTLVVAADVPDPGAVANPGAGSDSGGASDSGAAGDLGTVVDGTVVDAGLPDWSPLRQPTVADAATKTNAKHTCPMG